MITKRFSSKLDSITTSIFATMSKLAVEYNAVNLGQGFPDFDGPEWIKEEAYKSMLSGKNQYAPMNGILSLRNAISKIYKDFYSLEVNPDKHILITAGATEALYSTISALINPGDEVILFEPYYDSYFADVVLAGGKPVYVTLKKPNFEFDFEELEKAVTKNTKLIILNNPHNPTGKVYSLKELEAIREITLKYNLYLISDEVYEFLTFDGIKHIPMATLPDMHNRTITISSTGKTFSMTGWKIGYVVASEEIIEAVKKVHQWATFAVNTPGQHAMAYAFSRLEEYLPEFRAMYQSKRDLIFKLLSETPFKPHKPDGSYFLMVDIPDNIDDIKVAEILVKEFKVATIPPSVFYNKSNEGKSMLRLCFAKNDQTIIDGITNMGKFKLL